jgi:WD40 repeat protein
MFRRMIALLLLVGVSIVAAQDVPVEGALAQLSQQLGTTLTLDDLDTWSWSQEAFSDASLGCGQPGRNYAQVVTRGYIFLLTYQGTTYDFRSDSEGNAVLCDTFAALSEGTEEVASGVIEMQSLTGGSPITLDNAAGLIEITQLTVPGRVNPAAVAWSPGGTQIAVGTSDDAGTVYLIDPAAPNAAPQRIEIGEAVAALDYANIEGRDYLAAAGLNGRITYVQTNPMGLDSIVMNASNTLVTDVAVSTDGILIASTSGSPFAESESGVNLWNTRTGELLGTLEQDAPANVVAFSPAGTQLAVGDTSGTVTLWALDTNVTEEAVTLNAQRIGDPLAVHSDSVTDLKYSEDGSLLISTSADSSVQVWNIAGDGSLNEAASINAGNTLALSGSLLAVADDENISIWDIGSLTEPLATLPGVNIASLSFSPNGDYLLSTSEDGTLNVWGI